MRHTSQVQAHFDNQLSPWLLIVQPLIHNQNLYIRLPSCTAPLASRYFASSPTSDEISNNIEGFCGSWLQTPHRIDDHIKILETNTGILRINNFIYLYEVILVSSKLDDLFQFQRNELPLGIPSSCN